MLSILVQAAELAEKKRKQIHGIEDSDDEVNQITSTKREKNTIDFFLKKKSSGSGSGTSTNQATMNQFLKKELREEGCQAIARFFTIMQFYSTV